MAVMAGGYPALKRLSPLTDPAAEISDSEKEFVFLQTLFMDRAVNIQTMSINSH
jgi:hypothetical protein